jgi:chromosomal replication initiator protein
MNKAQFSNGGDNGTARAEQVWGECLTIIRDNIKESTFETWFLPIKAVALQESVLTLQVPSQFFYEWLEEHFVELLGKTLKRVLGKEGQLEYRIMMDNSSSKRPPATIHMPSNGYNKPGKDNYIADSLKQDDPYNIKSPWAIPGLKRQHIEPQLNANYVFDNFVEGECNRTARGAAWSVSQKPGTTPFNPLVVFGGVGWGKTHLVQAIGNEVRKNFPNKAVLYVSAEKFINQFIDHSKNNEVNDFIHFYQLIDVLILDDIQNFTSAPKSQDVFFSIFNHLHQSGKQIILTSDTPPKDLQGLQERLLSRFKWGLNIDIMSPDFETRKAILRLKMKQEGLEIPDEVVKYIAYNIQSNVRELEGAIIALFAQSTLNKKEIDIDLAKRVMKNFVKSAAKEVTIENIQKMVCDYFHVSYAELLTTTRKREIVMARQISMYLAKKFAKQSLKSIGDHFGGKDHTTVIHSCNTVENLMATDASYKENMYELQQKIQMAIA